MPKCVSCGKRVKEVCGDGYCRNCHVSTSWEDCITNTSVAKRNLQMELEAGVALGIPRLEIIKNIKSIYPAAKLKEYDEIKEVKTMSEEEDVEEEEEEENEDSEDDEDSEE